MSTRALYTFCDLRGEYHVYKHHDGYPSGAAQWIAAALPYAWPLPRFEADEFAAAFVAGNKTYDSKPFPGGVRLTQGATWKDAASADIEYRYEITEKGGDLHVAAYVVSCDWGKSEWRETKLFAGTLEAFTAWAKKSEAA
jgi:hypothetical protein